MNKIIIYTDGGSRGNPGPAALGVIIMAGDKEHEYSQFLGTATNNEAEYSAVVFGLKKAKQLAGKEHAKSTEVEVRADSELVVKQLNGEYKMREEKLFQFFMEIWNLRQDFKKVTFIHIFREQNKKADAMVNKELDNQQNGLF